MIRDLQVQSKDSGTDRKSDKLIRGSNPRMPAKPLESRNSESALERLPDSGFRARTPNRPRFRSRRRSVPSRHSEAAFAVSKRHLIRFKRARRLDSRLQLPAPDSVASARWQHRCDAAVIVACPAYLVDSPPNPTSCHVVPVYPAPGKTR